MYEKYENKSINDVNTEKKANKGEWKRKHIVSTLVR